MGSSITHGEIASISPLRGLPVCVCTKPSLPTKLQRGSGSRSLFRVILDCPSNAISKKFPICIGQILKCRFGYSACTEPSTELSHSLGCHSLVLDGLDHGWSLASFWITVHTPPL